VLMILWNKTELDDTYVLCSCTESYKFYLAISLFYRNVPGFTRIVSAWNSTHHRLIPKDELDNSATFFHELKGLLRHTKAKTGLLKTRRDWC